MTGITFILEDELAKYRSLFEDSCPPPLTIEKGVDLCTQCSTEGWMYYIVEGIAKVHITNSEGNHCIIDIMKKDTIIGMDCIIPDVKSVVCITGITDIKFLAFSASILKDLLAKNPDFAYDLLLYYGKVLRQVTYKLGMLSIRDLTVRLANFIFLFLDTPDYAQKQKIELTQDEVAAAINISRSQVAKIYSRFREDRIIEIGNGFITILDSKKLRSYCQF